ncbi:3-phosphoshikimate 1-carboxyvinyltransferase [Ottowia sp. oral taxon 894]|uniref:bifunctional 3-phosphoshikimate 1-carboxyvinyltransferase/cytidylate kinase n=1 Tax=Ottowia sp. oral taxon 894 TaxID=1658672 RepID=UPI0006811910|nr:bifunctional 3-phosphoshikimate 1-carboxyvinyltransferase/cytidylate kinase [Ottowia sp. oral taxon 894]AKU66479.1 3-phosphoshikimate 1-carboxyvinyltransferase [Ottowia sp. oral taxon 894]
MFTTEFLDVPALRAVQGRVRLPGSKSISNRVLLLAALSEGATRVRGLLDSDDTRVMLQALAQMGCGVRRADDRADEVLIEGLGGRAPASPTRLFLGNAGTAMRPLTAALALLGGEHELSGVARMHERPIGDLVAALRRLGCRIEELGQPGFPPLRIAEAAGVPPLALDAPVRVRGDVSSQFLTALLLALPLAAREREVTVQVEGELISRPYIHITLALLERFGVAVQRQGWERFVIPKGSRYQSPGEVWVEADASSASYFIAAGALSAPEGGEGLVIEGLGLDAVQGDIRFVEAARLMGADVQGGSGWLRARRGAWPLKAVDLDCNHIPDAAMTLAMMALYADGPSTLRNIASWRVKETDRIAAMTAQLRKLGAAVEEGADFIRITPPALAGGWRAASICTYDDHRMAMCASLAAFNPAALPVRVQDPKCVAKTFPDYFETLFAAARPARAVPVICIDGPTASGKGTLAAALAARLGWHYLDSGALYRATALAARQAGVALDDEAALARLAAALPLRFEAGRVWLDGRDVSEALRSEQTGMDASALAPLPAVRAALLNLQRGMARLPGLVADGRDMGTVVFADAPLKVFLTASTETRAERRYKQLAAKGISANIARLRDDLQARDARDASRAAAPLKAAQDALALDNSCLSIEQSVQQVLDWWQDRQPF